VTLLVTSQGTARALKHARAPSRPGNNGGAQETFRFSSPFAASFATLLRSLCCALAAPLVHIWCIFGAIFFSHSLLRFWQRLRGVFAALLLRRWCVFSSAFATLCGVFATLLAAPLRRLCYACVALLRRLCCAFAAPSVRRWQRLCYAFAASSRHLPRS
jgi:hypothetical protein